MSAEDLKKKLRDAAQQGGKIAIGSGTLSGAETAETTRAAPVAGPVEA